MGMRRARTNLRGFLVALGLGCAAWGSAVRAQVVGDANCDGAFTGTDVEVPGTLLLGA